MAGKKIVTPSKKPIKNGKATWVYSKKAKKWYRSIEMWHATLTQNVASIKKNGFKQSEIGRIGKGCYFTKKYYPAKKIAKFHVSQKFGGKSASVIRVRVQCKGGIVNLGRKTLDYAGQKKIVARGRVVCGTHGTWQGLQPFTEYCIHNPKRIKIVSVKRVS